MVTRTRDPGRGFQRPDIVVVGAGIAGLTAALACAGRGLRVLVFGPRRAGAASWASAGVLAPSVRKRPQGAVHRFMVAARDCYPGFLSALRELSAVQVPTVTGLLEVARSDRELSSLRATPRDADSRPLDALDVAALEPTLRCTAGGWLHARDGAVDAAALLVALEDAVARHPRVTRDGTAVREILLREPEVRVRCADGADTGAPIALLAAGAWCSRIAGHGLLVPVEPLAGEIAFAPRASLRHVVFGANGYLVPRRDELLVGATACDRGFDATPTAAAVAELRAVRDTLLEAGGPGHAPFHRHAVGLRPMTPDGLPVIGARASAPNLLYAGGYGRNGVLLAPLAAECIAALAAGDSAPIDLAPFAPDRAPPRRSGAGLRPRGRAVG